VVTGIAAGIDNIEYIVSNSCGLDTASKTVAINPLPDAGKITGDTMACKGAGFTLSAAADTGGMWSSSNTAIATIGSHSGTGYGLATGTTTITYTTAPNVSGCINMTICPLTIGAGFAISGNVSQIACYGMNNGSIATAVTGSTGPYQYIWSRGDSTSVIDSLAPGTYMVNIKDNLTQCIAADSFVITQPDSIAISADIKSDTCKSGQGGISIAATGGTAPYQYEWSNKATTSSVKGLIADTYVLTVTDINNCKKEDALIVADTCTGIIIHDVITPNGDGINDVWIIEGLQDYPKNTVQIFDKWGNMLYEKSDYNNDWGGRGSSGELLPDGTYFYLVKLNAENIYGGKNVFAGAILIKR
jgi:gliding motility-associated-like protein